MELTGIRYLDEIDFARRTVLCRVDFNVPLDGSRVADDTRIMAALPTIKALRDRGAKVVLASHLGRPKGRRDPKLSLEPAAMRLARILDCEVRFTDDCVGDGVQKVVADMAEGEIAVLENLRFHQAEKKNDPHFSKLLASPFDCYVNDAFGTCHRAHASMYGVVEHFDTRAAGYLVQREIIKLGEVMSNPATPFVAILGGAKVSDKLGVIRSLLGRCDKLLVGGAMAYTLLAAKGCQLGNSLVENQKLDLARGLLESAGTSRTELLLPCDHLIARSMDASECTVTDGIEIPDGWSGFDIGPKTLAQYKQAVHGAGSVLWNGPLGVFERPLFNKGTFEVAAAIAESSAASVVGGGDSAAAVRQAGLTAEIGHVSTGGGASLVFIEGKPLPGLEALRAGHSSSSQTPH